MSIQVCLHRGSGWLSKAIQWQTRSRYSHASMIFPSGLMIEAREGEGVQALPGLSAKTGEVVDIFTVSLTRSQETKVIAFATAQLGKPYDWTMVARFVSRRQESRASSGKWFCSELVFAAFLAAKVELLRDTDAWEVSPGLLARSPLLTLLQANVHPKPIAA